MNTPLAQRPSMWLLASSEVEPSRIKLLTEASRPPVHWFVPQPMGGAAAGGRVPAGESLVAVQLFGLRGRKTRTANDSRSQFKQDVGSVYNLRRSPGGHCVFDPPDPG